MKPQHGFEFDLDCLLDWELRTAYIQLPKSTSAAEPGLQFSGENTQVYFKL